MQKAHFKNPPVLLELAVVFLLWVLFLKIWWGNPQTVHEFKIDAGKAFLQTFYFVLLYFLLFSFSRTVSIRMLFKWFYLGLVIIPFVTFFVQKWLLGLAYKNVWYFGYEFGDWHYKHSIVQACVVGPIVEEVLKGFPLVLFLFWNRSRKSLRSFTLSDWLLIGFTIGSAFDLAEHLVWLQKERSSLLVDNIRWPLNLLGYFVPVYTRGSDLFSLFGHKFSYAYGSHGAGTAYFSFAIGLAAYLGRKGWKWSIWVWAIPVLALFLIIVDHGLVNLAGYQYGVLFKAPLIKTLYTLFLWGCFPTYGFLLLVFLTALYEYRQIHKGGFSVSRRFFLEELRLAGLVFWTFVSTSIVSCVRYFSADFKWRKLIGIPIFILAFPFALTNILLDFILREFYKARVRHGLAWSKS